MFEFGRRALVLGAHTDDEFACAGTIARLIESGAEVHLATFSSAEESVPDGFDRDVLKREIRAAIAVLGIAEERFRLHGLPVRHFPEHRQEVLERLVALRAEIEPDLVLLPALTDIHQDHGTVAREGLRAFKHATILGYEMPMNDLRFEASCYVTLEARHLDLKLRHAAAYASQGHRSYLQPEAIRSLAAVRGLQIGADAAEAFQVVRMAIR